MCTSESAIDEGRRGFFTTASALLLIVTLGVVAGVALSTANRSVIGSSEYARQTETLMLAEAAVENAMASLDAEESWSSLQLPKINYVYPHRVGPGLVWADIDNDVWDQGGAKDTNGLILVRGYSRHLSSEIAKGIEVLYWRPSFTIPPVAGVIICGEDELDSGNGNIEIDGYNHHLPEVGCTGSHCNAVRNGEEPDVAGVAFEVNGHESEVTYPRTLDGVPPISTANCTLKGPTGVCARMRLLMNNSQRLIGIETLTDWPGANKESYGSTSAPKLLRVAKGTSLMLNGNSQGAGIFFVEGTLEVRGTFTWTGAILLGPGATLDIRGTGNIFGSIITGGQPDNVATLKLNGNGNVAWASDAVRVGPFNMPGLLNSWREFQVEVSAVTQGR